MLCYKMSDRYDQNKGSALEQLILCFMTIAILQIIICKWDGQ